MSNMKKIGVRTTRKMNNRRRHQQNNSLATCRRLLRVTTKGTTRQNINTKNRRLRILGGTLHRVLKHLTLRRRKFTLKMTARRRIIRGIRITRRTRTRTILQRGTRPRTRLPSLRENFNTRIIRLTNLKVIMRRHTAVHLLRANGRLRRLPLTKTNSANSTRGLPNINNGKRVIRRRNTFTIKTISVIRLRTECQIVQLKTLSIRLGFLTRRRLDRLTFVNLDNVRHTRMHSLTRRHRLVKRTRRLVGLVNSSGGNFTIIPRAPRRHGRLLNLLQNRRDNELVRGRSIHTAMRRLSGFRHLLFQRQRNVGLFLKIRLGTMLLAGQNCLLLNNLRIMLLPIIRTRRSVFNNTRRVRRLGILISRASLMIGNVLKENSGRLVPVGMGLTLVQRVSTKGRIRRNNFAATIFTWGKRSFPSINNRVRILIHRRQTGNLNSTPRLGHQNRLL